MMVVHPSGYYAWKANPISARQKEDQRLAGLIKQFWLESGGVYGYRKVAHDLRDVGERCGKHRVYRLMKQEGLRAQVGYRRRPGHYGKPAVVAETDDYVAVGSEYRALAHLPGVERAKLYEPEPERIYSWNL